MAGDPYKSVTLINIGDDWQTFALRAVLECYGLAVHLHQVASAAQLVRLLDGSQPLAPYVVLMCHGDARGLALPELAPQIEAMQPFARSITPENMRSFLRLAGGLVLNTGCSLGTPEWAEVFLQAGCDSYIGACDDPEGDAALFYTLHFFYELCCRGEELKVAHRLAGAHNDEMRMFTLYKSTASANQHSDH